VAKILIIDDDEDVREILSARVKKLNHDVLTAATLEQGLEAIQHHSLDLVFLDVHLPDGNGLDVLPAIRQTLSQPEVIIITGMGSSQGAETAISSGAWDYIEKPFYKEPLILKIQQALEYRKAKQKQVQKLLLKTDDIVGKSSRLKQCLNQLAECAPSQANVLIKGESGTGKELFARAIHDNSLVSGGNYIIVDCAALPETLIESLLFGHRKGAFTGADQPSEGLIKMADNGTLFLDEIGELPLAAQKTLLRVLQEKRFRPVGSSTEITSHFRLISATNRNLEQMVTAGRFRKDLLFRLKTVVIELPPLRDRKEDIQELAIHYTPVLCRKHGIITKLLLPETLSILESHDWQGNVRELINVLEKALLSDPDIPIVYPMHLPAHIRIMHVKQGLKDTDPVIETDSVDSYKSEFSYERGHKMPTLPAIVMLLSPVLLYKTFRTRALDLAEEKYFHHLLLENSWDLNLAARCAGLSKNRLYFFIRKHNIKKN